MTRPKEIEDSIPYQVQNRPWIRASDNQKTRIISNIDYTKTNLHPKDTNIFV